MDDQKIILEHDLLGSKEFDFDHAQALLRMQEKRNIDNKIHPQYYIPQESKYIFTNGYIKKRSKNRNTSES